mgnify:CR=1 FL=1
MRFYGTGKTELKTTEHNYACDCVFVCAVFSFFQIDTNQSDLGLIAVATGEFDILLGNKNHHDIQRLFFITFI